MRLFLAIFPPSQIRSSFKEIQLGLQQYDNYLKFVNPKLIHLTMRFLGGYVSRESLGAFLSLLKKEVFKQESFNVRIKEVRFGFPGRRWPRILYVSVMRNEKLAKLVSDINSAISELNLEDIEEYKYRRDTFHFTLARTKVRLDKRVISNIRGVLEKVDLWEGFRVNSISLVESELRRDGPEYKVIEEIPLV